MAEAEAAVRQAERQLVVFEMGGESYAVEIGVVREIIRMQQITRVPSVSSSLEGVINLRGKLIAVVDLRKRLGIEAAEETRESRIIVIDVEGEDMGAMVDAVTEVIRLPANAVESQTELVAAADAQYVEGIAKLEERLVVLLDVKRILAAEDASVVAEAKEAVRR